MAERRRLKLYSSVVDRIAPVSSTEVANAAKLLENILHAVDRVQLK